MLIAQEEEFETDANGNEITLRPEVLLEAEISREPNPAEEARK